METTFISMHDLSLDARLLYVSASIVDILGWTPQEVVGKSCWEYFHPDEIPFARAIHGRGVQLDKAAVLNYCQIKNRDGRWVGCECVFTIVHDVLVASTSIYRSGMKSQKRATEAPIIRQLFSSSPRDPRYHMLSYISHKFQQDLKPLPHEPRAALFLNRFTRTLTIMYATNGMADVLGISAAELTGKSFYCCIQENCLREAVRCLESAKANDSIAYLRFWFRDPRQDDQTAAEDQTDNGHSSGDEDDGGVHLEDGMIEGPNEHAVSDSSISRADSVEQGLHANSSGRPAADSLHEIHSSNANSRTSSGNSTDMDMHSNDAIFDPPVTARSSSSSLSFETMEGERHHGTRHGNLPPAQIELEAVVSCTSDGLVVILRKAKPFVPHVAQPTAEPAAHPYVNGFFASPWATDPILPNPQQQHQFQAPNGYQPNHPLIHPTAAQAEIAANQGPASEMFMNTIREVAVFAWSLTGINGSLAQYGRGKPSGEAMPPGGLPIWEPDSNAGPEKPRPNGIDRTLNGSNGHHHSPYTANSHTRIDAYGHTVGHSDLQDQQQPGFPWSQIYPGQHDHHQSAQGQ